MQSERDLQTAAAERADARIAELEKEVDVLRSSEDASRKGRIGEGPTSNIDVTSDGVKGLREESNQTLHILVSELQQELRLKEDNFRAERQKLEASNKKLSAETRTQRDEVR